MSQLSDYTQDEIERLMAAPLLVGMYIMGSSLSGALGLMKEMMAAVETAMEAAQDTAASNVVHELFSSEQLERQEAQLRAFARNATDRAADFEQARASMLQQVQGAVSILSTKGDASETAVYRSLLIRAAENVAQAAMEGGFMGLGGELVNAKEKEAIREIRKAVGESV